MGKVRININNIEILAEEEKSLLQIALENEIDIPHLCYDERIKPYGACGLCVVETEGSPKLLRACATKPVEGMVIKTHSKRIVDTRKEALKLLCTDHRGDCRPPCMVACPAKTDCQGYVGLIANGEYREALKLTKENVPLPASIGRVCPHPCETACRRQMVEEPISIAALKNFIADMDLNLDTYVPELKKATGKSVAVVGAGPAGLSCAYYLAKEGHQVDIYEAMPKPGGMLRYGIPQYRLPKEVLDKEIDVIRRMGVNLIYNTKIGRDVSLEYLREQYNSVFLGIGAWESSKLGCLGEEAEGVIGGIDFLRKVASNEPVTLGKRVIVVGGGNTAMDVCRTAVRLGSDDVRVIYRRTREEMPAEKIEVIEAEEEGVKFEFLWAPIEVVSNNGRSTSLKCQKMMLGEPDASGRRKPIPIEGEIQSFEADVIISAIGQKINSTGLTGLETVKGNAIKVDEETYLTSLEGVFAGGDAITGPYIAVAAIGHGRVCADLIDSYLNGIVKKSTEPLYVKQEDLKKEDFEDRTVLEREHLRTLPADFRRKNFMEVNKGFTEEEARRESQRCLECGCMDYFECELYKYINEYEVDPQEYKGERPKHKLIEEHEHIIRNQDKCVLCGLCIRACEEVVGVTALGLVNRGFESTVMPEFGLKLKDSSCISCGECVNVCPTGACIEKVSVAKQVPVNYDSYEGICGYCSVGCKVKYDVKGSKVFRAVPLKDKSGLLCEKGKFGVEYINSSSRAFENILRAGDERKVNYSKAEFFMIKKLQAVCATYGKDSIAFAASPRLTNEELFLVRKLAERFKTKLLGSFTNSHRHSLEDIIGFEGSTSSFAEVDSAELILSFGAVAEKHPVLGIRLKDAALNKTKLISISPEKSVLHEWCTEEYLPDNGLNFVYSFIKALVELGQINLREAEKLFMSYKEFTSLLENVEIDENTYRLAKQFGEAKKTLIVIDENTVTSTAVNLLTLAARLTGKIGRPHRGVIIARKKNNSQGLLDFGFALGRKELIDKIDQGQIKLLVVFGENPIGVETEKADCFKKLDGLITLDLFDTETAQASELFIATSGSIESEGSYTSAERKVQFIFEGLKNNRVKTNFEVLANLLGSCGVDAVSRKDIVRSISLEVEGYSSMLRAYENRESFYTFDKVSIGASELTEACRINFEPMGEKEIFKNERIYDSIDGYWQHRRKGE